MSSSAASDRAGTLVCAGLRHVLDAERLLSDSPDQSWHLAGFGPECVRKACLGQKLLDRILGHDLAALSDQILSWAFALDLHAWRYRIDGLAEHYPSLADWKPSSRYERTGMRTLDNAERLVREAATITYDLSTALWMDGRISRVE
jgi:hypothetical protein